MCTPHDQGRVDTLLLVYLLHYPESTFHRVQVLDFPAYPPPIWALYANYPCYWLLLLATVVARFMQVGFRSDRPGRDERLG